MSAEFKGDGVADDTAAIQKLLDQGGELELPTGTYRVTDTLRVGSNTRLHAAPDAVVRLESGSAKDEWSFLLRNANAGNGNENIVVEGGVWDYNNEGNARGKDGDLHSCTGAALNFVNVRGLELRGLVVRNPDAYSIRVGECSGFVVENIGLDHPVMRLNQDGVHVGGYCDHGVIRAIKALSPKAPNDDMVALNADDNVERAINLGMRRGPIRDIKVENLEATEAFTLLRLLSVDKPIERITVDNVKGDVRINALNLGSWAYAPGVGAIRDVTLSNWVVGSSPRGHRGHLMEIALDIDNLVIDKFVVRSGSVDVDTLWIHNDARWRLRLEGLDERQIEELLDASTRLAVISRATGVLELEGAKDTRLTLPNGSIGRLELHKLQA